MKNIYGIVVVQKISKLILRTLQNSWPARMLFEQIDIKRPEKKLKSDFSPFFVAKIGINLVAILSRRVIVKKF